MKAKQKKETKKTTKKKDETRVVKIGFFAKIKRWFKSVQVELAQVTWPNRKEMIKYSIATLVFVIFFAGYFYLISVIMAFLKSMI